MWPCGQPRPLTSNTNIRAGQTVAAAAIVGVGVNGSICITANTAVNVIVDVQGWFDAGSHYTARVPTRVIDTRERPAPTANLVSAEGLQIDLAASGVPADARAVAVNITVTNSTADGFAVVSPCGRSSDASTVNFLAGQTAANLAITGRSPSGSICVRTNVAADIIVDVQGWFETASSYRPLTPSRLVVAQTSQAGTIFRVPIAGSIAPPGSAAMLNLTMTDVAVGGWALVWPCGATVPLASNVNAATWHTVANAVLAAVNSDGEVCMTTNAATKLILDASGGFTAVGDYHPLTPARVLDTRDA